MRLILVSGLLFILSGGPVLAQDAIFRLPKTASSQVAAQPQPRSARPLRTEGFFWTGVGLLLGGSAVLVQSTRLSPGCDGCNDQFEHVVRVAGLAMMGAGGVVLGVGGHVRRRHEVTFTPRQVVWRVRF